MPVNAFRTLLIFGALYCATQGALDTWDEAYELPYLSSSDLTVSQIALAQTLGVIPMIMKGLLCVPSDLLRVRKPFVFAGLLLSGGMFFVQTTFDAKRGFALYIITLIVRNAGAALSDGAVDGLTIDADIEALSGTISAWQGVGRMSGLIVSALVGGRLAGISFGALLIFLGAWMIASAPVAGIVSEETPPSALGARALAEATRVADALSCGAFSRAYAPVAAKRKSEAALDEPDGESLSTPNPLRALGAGAAAASAEGAAEGVDALGGGGAGGGPAGGGSADGGADGGGGSADGGAPPLLLAPQFVTVASPLAWGEPRPPPQTLPPPSPPPAPPAVANAQLTAREAVIVLLKHCTHAPVAAFVCFMFLGQLATYIASFPVVLWVQEEKDFSLDEVGYLTIIGAFGNMAGCYFAGVGFDAVESKRAALVAATLLSTLPYLLFSSTGSSKSAVIAVWTLAQIGYGALYTVQTGQLRMLADASVAAAYSGLCMGALALSAAVGTLIGGAIAEGGAGGYDYTSVFNAGVGTSLAALLCIPWITRFDPEFAAAHAAARAAERAAAPRRRRSSIGAWLASVRGGAPAAEAAAAAAADAEAADADDSRFETPARPLLKRPVLGSLGNLLAARDNDPIARLRAGVLGLFDDGARRRRRRRNSDGAAEGGGACRRSGSRIIMEVS